MKDWNTVEPDETMILTKHFTPGRAGHRIDKIVVHHNAGNLSIKGCYDAWQTREASAHYQVDAHGRIGQLVWDRDTAWHAGNALANQTSIGIEHADISSTPWSISDATLDNGAHLVAALCRCYGLGRPVWGKNVFPHSDFSATACPASIAGSQRDAYMRRAQDWYDRMTGKKPAANVAVTIDKEKAMATTHILFRKAGTNDIYIAYINAGVYRRIGNPDELNTLKYVLGKAGATLKTWAQCAGGKGSGYGDVAAKDMPCFGIEQKR